MIRYPDLTNLVYPPFVMEAGPALLAAAAHNASLELCVAIGDEEGQGRAFDKYEAAMQGAWRATNYARRNSRPAARGAA